MKAKKQRRKHKTPQKKLKCLDPRMYMKKQDKRGKSFRLYSYNSPMMKAIREASDEELKRLIADGYPVWSKLCLRELHEREYGKVS